MAQTKIEQGLLKFTEATDYLKIPTGTTAQRPSSPEAGYIRFNTTVSKFEIYNGTDWTEPGVNPPTVTSLDYPATKTALDPAGGETLLINGTNFQAGITVDFGGTAATSITINSSTQLSVVAPAKAAGNVTLTITNTDTGSVQTTVVYNALPTWTTAAGSLGSVAEGASISFTVAASEADSGTITYSVTSGSLPTGASLNSSTGAITGTAPDVSADTTYNFTITATDDENQTASRAFSITVTDILPSSSFGTILYEGDGTSGHSINGGKFGAAFYGNGSNSRIDSTSIGSWPSGNAARSISFWMNSDSYANGGIVAYGTASSNQGFAFYISSSQLIMTFYGVNANINYALSADQWYHVVATHDGTTFKAYINGSQEYSDTRTLNTGTTGFRIGGVPWNNGGEFFNGKIDQVRVFSKALSSSEVTTLYSETASTVESLDPLSEDTTGTLQVLGDSSCVAAYKFENDETDLSGNYNGTGTAIQYAAGRYGQGADFNGTTSQITTSNITGLDTTTISISCWVYMHEVSTFNHFVSRFGTGGHSTYQFILRNTSAAKWSLATYDGTGSGDSLTSTATASANTWYHVAAVIDGTSKKIYVNGSEVASSTVAFSVNTSSGEGLNIGGRDDFGASNSERMNGKIDQVRVFSKALSASEVSTLYAETASTVESLDPLSEDTTDTLQVLGDSSCIATYRFENNEDDLSGNYDGTGTEIQYAVGRYGQAASFNGSSSYIYNTNTAIWSASWTISLWFKTPNSSGRNPLFTFGRGSWVDGIELLNAANNTVSISYAEGTKYASKNVSVDLDDNNFHHYCATYDSSSDTIKLYIDGNEETSLTTGTGNSRQGSGYRIGRFFQTPEQWCTGDIDQLRVFNKALSASEVTTLYNENSLVASYRFEGNANDDTRNYDGTASNVTYEYGLNFTPDFVWLKSRTTTYGHRVIDTSTGTDKYLETNSAASQQGAGGAGLISFDTGGFTVGSGNAHNANGNDFVAWCLKANGGTTSSNTDGNVTTTVQVNETAGFSIGTMSSTGITSSQTFGHGLGNVGDGVPDLLIVKGTSAVSEWRVYSSALNNYDGFLQLYTTAALYTAGIDSTFNSSTFNLQWTGTAQNWVFYAFKQIEGFSKFGTYTGTGGDLIVETGFEPAFLMIKRTDSGNEDWFILDNKRNPVDYRNTILRANATDADTTVTNGDIDVKFLSNGFAFDDIPSTSGGFNASGGTYFYIAFAADPDTEAPAVAKSFTSVAYTGTGTNQKVEGLGFAPNLVWIKSRSTTNPHVLHDTVRGIGNVLYSNLTNAEADESPYFTSVGYDYLQFGTNAGNYNNTGTNYVAWAWKADDNEPTITGGSALAAYKFEDNANDVRGNYNGTATNITYTTGKFNKAAVFAQSSNSKLDFSNSLHGSTFSMSFWIKPTDLPGTDATAYSIYSAWVDVNNYFRPVLYGDGSLLLLTKYAGTFKSNRTSSGILTENTWHHIVFNFTPTDTNAYVDGVNVGTFPAYDSISFTSKAFGTDRGTPNLTAHIDQLRFYDAALIQENVTALYNETASDNDDLTLGAPGETIISANANAGFSIVKYQGDGVVGKQVPHGLSATPEMIILKDLDQTVDWAVYHVGTDATSPEDYKLELNTTDARIDQAGAWNDTAPNATTFTLGGGSVVNTSGNNYIAYCFHSVSGYSKIGSYSGTGTTNSITGLGFQPDWIMIKRTTAAHNWVIADSVRGDQVSLFPNLSNAESDQGGDDLVSLDSNGFTVGTNTRVNSNGDTFIYMAFKIN